MIALRTSGDIFCSFAIILTRAGLTGFAGLDGFTGAFISIFNWLDGFSMALPTLPAGLTTGFALPAAGFFKSLAGLTTFSGRFTCLTGLTAFAGRFTCFTAFTTLLPAAFDFTAAFATVFPAAFATAFTGLVVCFFTAALLTALWGFDAVPFGAFFFWVIILSRLSREKKRPPRINMAGRY
ncbi:MAG: hypothetical protein WC889_13565 [Myxococcota bacterium]